MFKSLDWGDLIFSGHFCHRLHLSQQLLLLMLKLFEFNRDLYFSSGNGRCELQEDEICPSEGGL